MIDQEDIIVDKRELGEEEDLELAIDRDNQVQEKDLRTKILFSMQGLGAVRTIDKEGKKIQAYIKGEYCQESIKDLVKNIRDDVPENPKVKLILSQFNIVESDLVKLLVLHAQDKKLSFWLLALLSYITVKPSDNLMDSQKTSLNNALKQYKRTFMKNQGLTYLILHISDYVRTPPEKRQKAHYQMMEFIINLIRNFLQFRVTDIQRDELHSHFLVTILKEDMMGPLLYLIQMKNEELLMRIQIQMLQIFYHIFTCFNPKHLYDLKKTVNFKQQALKMANRKSQPVRHSRFLPNFLQKNMSGVVKITHSLDKKEEHVLPGQRKIPNRLAQLKKVNQIQNDYVEQNFLQLIIEGNQESKQRSTVRETIFYYAKQFVEVQFEHLSTRVFDQLFKETLRVTNQNIMQYLILCSWELKMTRCKYRKNLLLASTPQQKGMVQFEFNQILCIMQTGHFEMIHKILFKEATKEKKKNFDVNMFHAALILFLQYIEVIEDISISFNMSDRKNANALMNNMFRHDIARIFKIGFHRITHQKILSTLIKITHKFFKLLSVFSKGKVLTIQTNRLLKGRNNKKNDQQVQGFIEEDSDDQQNDSQSYRGDQQKQPKKEKQKNLSKQQMEEEKRFQERKYNEMSQFAIIADYETISKYLIFLKHERFKQNSSQLNKAIFFYFERIVNLLKGEWLFFQAQTLTTLNEVLASSQFCKQYREARETIKHICTSFIKLLRKNKLAIVESLFRYSTLKTKEQIFMNYENEQEYQVHLEEKEGNLFVD